MSRPKKVPLRGGLFYCPEARHSKGFTLIEMVAVILVLGILSVTIIQRMDVGIFDSRGFFNETLAMLRYAQKTAVSQRHTVCVAFTTSSASLSIAAIAGSSNCDTSLVGPRGENPASVTAKTGIAYASTPVGFSFNALGKPSFSTTRTLQVAGISDVITIEAETGYVH